ncbi:UPF0133 protein ybaB [Alkalidesulfovibrio alkalitolerans DSM 16529]|uniref:Nucleoid-associated protein dsat_2303 n=1 Tax=Alkalidesulfovibrio alkalitolerans DSM 16529 TaxID=1121439 RepID=S7TED3_9BACT|nr:YbaB/EbfC family nucleoid-associated protein [Alkalidesulfovibrio alkalitolerans]EPR34940.1 UPF0133 protein ybaB [Alkalidesulfovibrio alkalitolerans DSM 16529]
MRGMNDLVRQAQMMQKKMADLQKELAERTVEAQSGGGMVSVTANCSGEIVAIRIDKSVVDPQDVEMLQDLVLAAIKEAIKQANELREAEMTKITGGIKLPGIL